jgi:hypothetical protein
LFVVEFGDLGEVGLDEELDGLQALGSEVLLLGSTKLVEHAEGDVGGGGSVKVEQPLDRSAYPGVPDAGAPEQEPLFV